MLDQKQLSLEEKVERPKKIFSKAQAIGFSIIAFIGMIACSYLVLFGANTLADSSDLTEQVRQEKFDYIQMRITQEKRQILEASLYIKALEDIKKTVDSSADPSAIDIEVEANKLLDF